MIAPQELLEIKARLITAAESARAIASSASPVYYDEEEYGRVYQALQCMKGDITRVLAELDVLRGMFATNLTNFFMEGVTNGLGVSDGRGAVGQVQDAQGGPSGEEVGTLQPSGAGGGVQEERPARKRRSRSQPRRNRKGDGGAEAGVGSGDGAGQVDSGAQA